MIKNEYKWNPVYNLVMKIKYDYINTFNDDIINLETWIEKLDKKEYNDFFECLQIRQRDDLILIRYGLAEMQRGMWEDKKSPYRECRSIVIDIKNDNIVSCPFTKFFNLNEVDENNEDIIRKEIEIAKTFEITNKLDGSMQTYTYYNNKIYGFGSMSLSSSDSWRLEDGFSMLTENHKKMIELFEHLTFIFEYISLKDSHVVNYKKEEEGLYLIGVRNKDTGVELDYDCIKYFSDSFKIPIVEIESLTFDELLEQMKVWSSDNKEGWVLNVDGHRIKMKCDDYCGIHRILDKLASVNVVIKSIANDTFDDVLSKIPESHKERVVKIANKVFEYKRDMESKIDYWFNNLPNGNRKDVMIFIDENVPKEVIRYVKNKYLGQDFNLLKNGNLGYKKIKDIDLQLEDDYE